MKNTYARNYDYNWKITARKGLIVLAEILIAGTIVYLTDNMLFLFLVPVLEMLRNYLKHK